MYADFTALVKVRADAVGETADRGKPRTAGARFANEAVRADAGVWAALYPHHVDAGAETAHA